MEDNLRESGLWVPEIDLIADTQIGSQHLYRLSHLTSPLKNQQPNKKTKTRSNYISLTTLELAMYVDLELRGSTTSVSRMLELKLCITKPSSLAHQNSSLLEAAPHPLSHTFFFFF
jgi:hypothetical protein